MADIKISALATAAPLVVTDDVPIARGTATNHKASIQQIADLANERSRVAGSTYSTTQHLQDIFHSSGVTTGGTITDDADGTITVSLGTGLIRATNSAVAELLFFDWAAEAGANVGLTDNDMNYVYVEYNAGSPQVVATTTKRTEEQTNVFLGTVYRIGTVLHITESTRAVVGDHALQMIKRLRETMPFARVSGGVISEAGTRNIAITAGEWWENLTDFTTPAVDTSVAGTFGYYYADGIGGWTTVAASTQIDNTQYDDGSGTLATLSNNKYGVHWVYQGQDGDFYVVYGTTNGKLSVAESAGLPASLPPHFAEAHARLMGRVIIGKSDSAFADIASSFDSQFNLGTAIDHGDLSGLADDDHTQYVPVDGSRNIAADTDLTLAIGKVIIGGSVISDNLIISHYNNNTAARFALRQTSAGQTRLNAGNSQNLILAIGNSEAVTVDTNKTVTIEEKLSANATVTVLSTTSETVLAAHESEELQLNNASPITLTVDTNANQAFDQDALVFLRQTGAGVVTVAAAVGVTIHSPGGLLALDGQYAGAVLQKDSVLADTWYLEGRLA